MSGSGGPRHSTRISKQLREVIPSYSNESLLEAIGPRSRLQNVASSALRSERLACHIKANEHWLGMKPYAPDIKHFLLHFILQRNYIFGRCPAAVHDRQRVLS